MYGIEYEDDILLLLRMIKFLHMQSPDAAHIFCQSHPVVDMEELLMVIDEVMWDIFDDVSLMKSMKRPSCNAPIQSSTGCMSRGVLLIRSTEAGKAYGVKSCMILLSISCWGQQTPFTNSHSISPEIMSFWSFACRRITTSRSILQIRWWICFVTANAASGE